MLLDVLGIVEDFSKSYGICEEIANSISLQPDLTQHYAVYFCPACFNANYVDCSYTHNVVACWQCKYEGFSPGKTDEDCHHVGCDCEYCLSNHVVGLQQLPTRDQCGCDTCFPVKIEPPGTFCPGCASDRVDIDNGEFRCNSCGNEYAVEFRMEIKKWPEPTRPINLEELANLPKFKVKDFNTDEILVSTFDPVKSGESIPGIRAKRFLLVDEASRAAKVAIQKEEDQNIFAALIKAADDVADIQAQLAAIVNDPNLTIITKSHWDHSLCNDAGDMFDPKLKYD